MPFPSLMQRRIVPAGWRLMGPLLLLATEMAILSPLVEFTAVPMRYLASPLVASAILFALAAFFLSAGARAATTAARPRYGWGVWLLLWGTHLTAYAAFLALSLVLHRGEEAVRLLLAGGWLLLGLAVAGSACCLFLTPATLLRIASGCRRELLASGVAAVLLAGLTPVVQPLWYRFSGPATWIVENLLNIRHDGIIVPGGFSLHGIPVIGVLGEKRVTLMVTSGCAEMESLLALLLLGLVPLVCRPGRIQFSGWIVVAVSGLAAMYVLNAVRLALLVEIGIWSSPRATVSLAHSRISDVLFLAISLVIWQSSRRLWIPSEPPAVAENGARP